MFLLRDQERYTYYNTKYEGEDYIVYITISGFGEEIFLFDKSGEYIDSIDTEEDDSNYDVDDKDEYFTFMDKRVKEDYHELTISFSDLIVREKDDVTKKIYDWLQEEYY